MKQKRIIKIKAYTQLKLLVHKEYKIVATLEIVNLSLYGFLNQKQHMILPKLKERLSWKK